MTTRMPDDSQHLDLKTAAALQELIHALKGSANYYMQAADEIEDDFVQSEFFAIATERKDAYETVESSATLVDESMAEERTWLGSLRIIWTAFRAGVNSGDPMVVLSEAVRAEEVITGKFKEVLPQIAGNPFNDTFLEFYGTVKAGHDRVLAMRDSFQNA